ncbi:MAG: hypothetical protein GWP15_04275 [Nitrospirae bacterium]|nr:hypothetical protein [Nitrospirota bacterium]
MEIDDKKFDRLKESVKKQYDSLDSVHCPYFKDKVHFKSFGYQHMFHKGPNNITRRLKKDQYIRMKLFKYAPILLRDSKTVQEYQKKQDFIPVTHNNRTEKVLKDVEYWGFLGIVDDKRIKVVVKKIGRGQLQYWSILPKWKSRRKGGKQDFVNYIKDLESI